MPQLADAITREFALAHRSVCNARRFRESHCRKYGRLKPQLLERMSEDTLDTRSIRCVLLAA